MIKPLYLLRGVVSLGIVSFLSEYDVKDSMRATACLIHVGGSHSSAETISTFLSVCVASCLFAPMFLQQGGHVSYYGCLN